MRNRISIYPVRTNGKTKTARRLTVALCVGIFLAGTDSAMAGPVQDVTDIATGLGIGTRESAENLTGNISANATGLAMVVVEAETDPDPVTNATGRIVNITQAPGLFVERQVGVATATVDAIDDATTIVAGQVFRGVGNVTSVTDQYVVLAGTVANTVCNQDIGSLPSRTDDPCVAGSIGKTILTSGASQAAITFQNTTRDHVQGTCTLGSTTFNVPIGAACALVPT